MNPLPTTLLTRRALLALGLVVSLLLGSVGVRTAHAEDDEEVHSLVSDRVLTLMGLEPAHTVVLGARLPGRPGDLFHGLGAGALRERAQDILEQNREDFVARSDLDRKASSVALVVALDGGGDGLWDRPFGIDWLTLEDVNLVFAFTKGQRTSDINPTISTLMSDPRGGTFITKDSAEMAVGLAATMYVHETRVTVAVSLSRDVDVKASLMGQVKKLRAKRKAKREAEAVGVTNTTTSHAGLDDPYEDSPEPPATNATSSHAGLDDTDDSEPESVTDAPASTPETKAKPKTDVDLSIAMLVDELDLDAMRALADRMGIEGPFDQLRSNRPFALREVLVALELDARALVSGTNPVKGASLFGSIDLLDGRLEAFGLVSLRRIESKWVPMVAFRLSDIHLQEVAPELEGSLVGELRFPAVAFTYTWGKLSIRSTDLNPAEAAFYDEVAVPFGMEHEKSYTLSFREGMNVTGPLPVAILPEAIMTALGIVSEASTSGAPYIILEGSPGLGLGLDFGGFPRLADMALRATLPPISPEHAPAWLVRGELYIEVTGAPSITLGGALTLDLSGDEVEFFLEGSLARDGAGVSLALVGGIAGGQPWQSPFGIGWLTLNEVILKLAINVNGNLSLGFRADMVVGTRTIDVAALIAINVYSGVPSNFVLEGAAEKLALDDLALLQEAIARSRGRTAKLPIRSLPNVEIRNMYLRFAPKADADLGVEAGLGLAGALWIETSGGTMANVAAIDADVSPDGISLLGAVRGYSLGPITWTDAIVDMALLPGLARLRIEGEVRIAAVTRSLSVNLTPRGMLQDFLDAHGATLANVKDAVANSQPVLVGRRVIRSVRNKLRWGR
ncbi:MAG: hypothetical protein AB7T63_11945 [Planctomycetota bacterium]